MDDIPILLHWDEQPHVIAASPNEEYDWEEDLQEKPWRDTVIAELDGRPIGIIQIIDPALEETHYWGDCPENLRAMDIWIGEASDLGKGYGTVMMHLALERCFSDPKVTAVWIDPLETNEGAIRFYYRIGFKFLERRQFEEDICLILVLDRGIWDGIKGSLQH